MGSVKSKKTCHYIRRAKYAGSWYEAQENALDKLLSGYLQDAAAQEEASEEQGGVVRGLVAPHAGYDYSGPTAAYAYRALIRQLQQQQQQHDGTILLVLHPAHYVHLDGGCAVSNATLIETPLGNLTVNQELCEELLQSSNKFTTMSQDMDEQEHSGELHYPYIAKSCRDAGVTVTVLPIMVGSLNEAQSRVYGELLAPIVARPHVVTIVSTDFCHWGLRFQYTPFCDAPDSIFARIEEMDQTGMRYVSMQEPGAFAQYLKETRNTICGRHPLSVWLHAVKANKTVEHLDIKFVRYEQSSQVRSKTDSSVSYASAVAQRVNGR